MQVSIDLIFGLAILVMSVVVHEVSHGYVANALGDPTARLSGRLTLNPLAHLDPVGSVLVPIVLLALGAPVFGWARPVPYNPYNLRVGTWGPGIVAFAGPLSNMLIAVVFGFVLRFGAASGVVSQAFGNIAAQVIMVNLLLAVFNLIPVPPFDGSKVLFSFLPSRFYGMQRFLEGNQVVLMFLLVIFITRIDIIMPIALKLFEVIVGVSVG